MNNGYTSYASLRELLEQTQEHPRLFDVALRNNAGVLRAGEFEITCRDTPKWMHNRQEGGFGESTVTREEIQEESWFN